MGYMISVLVSAHTVFGFLMLLAVAVLVFTSVIMAMDFLHDDISDRQASLFKKFLLPLFGALALGFILTPGSVLLSRP